MRKSPKSSLWQVCITTTAEAEDTAMEALASEFGAPASCYTDFETHLTQASVYLEDRPGNLDRCMRVVRARLMVARANGIRIGPAKVLCQRIKRENWAESWKRHFKPLNVGSTLLLKPGWSRRKPKAGQAVVVLNPGLSFGTGHHATTSFCLREVVRFARNEGGSFLDIGTGSGILAIAAAKLGCTPIEAFDFDPEAVRVARSNARQNRVQHRLHLFEGDVTQLPVRPARQFDLVCANLISNLLMAERKRIAARVEACGTLVLAGILRVEFDKVRETFEALGLKLVRQRDEKEWTSGAFVWAR